MKLVKKILRLMPFVFLFAPVVIMVFNKGVFNGLTPTTNLVDYLGSIYGLVRYSVFLEEFVNFINLPIISSLYNWFIQYFGNSAFFMYAFVVMFYELFLSIIFIMFDFINLIFGWTNKLIKKGGALDE